jgi:hypothetical protein
MRRAAFIAFVLGLLVASGWGYAQERAQAPIVPFPGNGNILSGPDIGFRVETTSQGKVIGRLVVRMKDGSWVEAQLGRGGVHPLRSE